MTIIYQFRVATTSLGGFLKLLYAWRGSVYKLLYKELVIFVSLYAFVSLIYRLALTASQRVAFEGIVLELHSVSSAIPLSFVLGFYVTFIVQRWWQQFTNVPWPDRTLFIMCTYLHGFDDKARMMRRSVARYMLFGLILITRAVSVAVMKRFPTIDHIVEAGFITKEEAALYEGTQCKYLRFWVPLMWANNVLVTARREGRIQTDFGLRMAIQQLADFRDKCSLCFVYDWITVPLVYTQVVTFAVYSYFFVSLFGQQYLDPTKHYKGFEQDFYFPGFTILQFLFYMGWLKVAEQMINPFGEDDDDYDINWLIDRHTAVAFALVDQCYGTHPNLTRDQFWNDVAPDVPYTESSLNSIRPNFLGSTFNVARPSLGVEAMVMRDNEFLSANGSPRARSRSKTGSLLSLLPFRHLKRQGTGDSQTTLESTGSGHARFHSVPNGKLSVASRDYHPVDNANIEDEMRRTSVIGLPVTQPQSPESPGVPSDTWHDETYQLRARASTDLEFRDVEEKERKLSLPFSIHLFTKNKQKKTEAPPHSSPKLNRFTVEAVKEETVNELESKAKTRRSGHVAVGFQNVSRVPELSAIEEGSTVTSMQQMLSPASTDNTSVFSSDERIYRLEEDEEETLQHDNKVDDKLTDEKSSRPEATPSVRDETKEPSTSTLPRGSELVGHNPSVQAQTSADVASLEETKDELVEDGIAYHSHAQDSTHARVSRQPTGHAVISSDNSYYRSSAYGLTSDEIISEEATGPEDEEKEPLLAASASNTESTEVNLKQKLSHGAAGTSNKDGEQTRRTGDQMPIPVVIIEQAD